MHERVAGVEHLGGLAQHEHDRPAVAHDAEGLERGVEHERPAHRRNATSGDATPVGTLARPVREPRVARQIPTRGRDELAHRPRHIGSADSTGGRVTEVADPAEVGHEVVGLGRAVARPAVGGLQAEPQVVGRRQRQEGPAPPPPGGGEHAGLAHPRDPQRRVPGDGHDGGSHPPRLGRPRASVVPVSATTGIYRRPTPAPDAAPVQRTPRSTPSPRQPTAAAPTSGPASPSPAGHDAGAAGELDPAAERRARPARRRRTPRRSRAPPSRPRRPAAGRAGWPPTPPPARPACRCAAARPRRPRPGRGRWRPRCRCPTPRPRGSRGAPHPHARPSGSTITWPMCPALPAAPSSSRPSSTMPPPTPVDTTIAMKSRWPRGRARPSPRPARGPWRRCRRGPAAR